MAFRNSSGLAERGLDTLHMNDMLRRYQTVTILEGVNPESDEYEPVGPPPPPYSPYPPPPYGSRGRDRTVRPVNPLPYRPRRPELHVDTIGANLRERHRAAESRPPDTTGQRGTRIRREHRTARRTPLPREWLAQDPGPDNQRAPEASEDRNEPQDLPEALVRIRNLYRQVDDLRAENVRLRADRQNERHMHEIEERWRLAAQGERDEARLERDEARMERDIARRERDPWWNPFVGNENGRRSRR